MKGCLVKRYLYTVINGYVKVPNHIIISESSLNYFIDYYGCIAPVYFIYTINNERPRSSLTSEFNDFQYLLKFFFLFYNFHCCYFFSSGVLGSC